MFRGAAEAGDQKTITTIIENLAKTAFSGGAFNMLPVVDAEPIISAQKQLEQSINRAHRTNYIIN